MPTLQPVAKRALLAAHAAQGRTLRRTRGGFAGLPAQITTSSSAQIETFTRRAINWLDNAGLVAFDDPDFPSAVTLNPRGIAHAQQLLAEQAAKEHAA
ncbi:MAG: hypothetical protein ACOH1V_02435 [Stenotrophomonas sp.]